MVVDGRPPGEKYFSKSTIISVQEQVIQNDTEKYVARYDYDKEMSDFAINTRHVIDQVTKMKVAVKLRKRSWNQGLVHLPVYV